ncbi:MAG: hypothetical protein J7502_04995 [Flavisolibacter sp.]|nr:hypothetical protein [Flavisolibacter sp.]
MKKAKMPPKQMADQAALALGNSVLTGLTGNPDFPNPKVPLADLQTSVNTTTASIAKADKGSSQDKAQKNADKAVLLGLLREQCDYVNDVAQGRLVILSGCGYDLSKEPQPRVLGVADPKLENGLSGQMISSTPAVTGSVAYKHQYTTDLSIAVWPEILTSRATCKIEGQVPGTILHSRIVSIGTNGQVTVSEVVSKMVA